MEFFAFPVRPLFYGLVLVTLFFPFRFDFILSSSLLVMIRGFFYMRCFAKGSVQRKFFFFPPFKSPFGSLYLIPPCCKAGPRGWRKSFLLFLHPLWWLLSLSPSSAIFFFPSGFPPSLKVIGEIEGHFFSCRFGTSPTLLYCFPVLVLSRSRFFPPMLWDRVDGFFSFSGILSHSDPFKRTTYLIAGLSPKCHVFPPSSWEPPPFEALFFLFFFFLFFRFLSFSFCFGYPLLDVFPLFDPSFFLITFMPSLDMIFNLFFPPPLYRPPLLFLGTTL